MARVLSIVALSLAPLSGSFAGGDTGLGYSFNGFGTLGGVYSDQQDADFVSSWFLQPNGAGHTQQVHFGVDTRLGGQLDLRFNQRLSAVVQLVTERGHDNNWEPELEWANFAYRVNDDLLVRGGRTLIASFMLSDSGKVGYANYGIRNPQEVYGINPVSKLDGLDLLYFRELGNWYNTLRLTVGITEADVPRGGKLDAKRTLVIANSLDWREFTFRGGYIRAEIDLESEMFDALFAAFDGLGSSLAAVPGLEAAAAQSRGVATRYGQGDARVEILSLGLRYDPEHWLVQAEITEIKDVVMLAETRSWYLSVVRSIGDFSPYLTLAESNAEDPPQAAISAPLPAGPLASTAALLNDNLNAGLALLAQSQRSLTLGMRWDVAPDIAIKFEYQHIDTGAGSAGRLSNVQPGFEFGGQANVLSLAVDFVF